MHSEVAISVKGLAKTYRMFGHPGDRIKQFLGLGLKKYHAEFTALRDVSFDIKKGETVGIIGRNGSGKSTLLQLICGILKPTLGSVQVNGRISALLELGAGFNPEFTGRENVYFQGALTGFTQAQMAERFDAIAAFADIGKFLDQPVRVYSSGMFVRLAFAVAVHVDPDLLVVDEALAVGDMAFQAKCFEHMHALQAQGTSILVVSHALPIIRNFCQRAIWLDGGRQALDGPADQVCTAYQRQAQDIEHAWREQQEAPHGSALPSRSKVTAPHLRGVRCSAAQINPGGCLTISFDIGLALDGAASTSIGIGVLIYNAQDQLVAVFNTIRDDLPLLAGNFTVQLQLDPVAFLPGHYRIDCNLCDDRALYAHDRWDHAAGFHIIPEFNRFGIPRWEGQLACPHHWET